MTAPFSLEELRLAAGTTAEEYKGDPISGMTSREWASYWNVSERKAQREIRNLVEAGVLFVSTVMGRNIAGQDYKKILYRVKETE
jgi:predicted DNA-binding transcriptional regulator YafY